MCLEAWGVWGKGGSEDFATPGEERWRGKSGFSDTWWPLLGLGDCPLGLRTGPVLAQSLRPGSKNRASICKVPGNGCLGVGTLGHLRRWVPCYLNPPDPTL